MNYSDKLNVNLGAVEGLQLKGKNIPRVLHAHLNAIQCSDDPDISNDVNKDKYNEIILVVGEFEENTLSYPLALNDEENAQHKAVELEIPSNHIGGKGTRLELGHSLKLAYNFCIK